jgi:DnaK suppressor protein
MMTREQLEHFRALLLRDRAAAEERIGERSALIPQTARELADDPADLGDQAALVEEREEAMRGNEDDRDLLDRIQRALARLQAGTYGVSEVSGRPIPVERLEAIPWATTLAGEGPTDDDA